MTASETVVRVFVQARMSSQRFPGKVLAPLGDLPVIAHVLGRLSRVVESGQIAVLTSTESTDDPLHGYVEGLGFAVSRGSLSNVFGRFRACLEQNPCDWFFRVTADSPFVNTRLLERMITHAGDVEVDLVTNLFPRTAPAGRSLEMVNAETFSRIDTSTLTPDQREHVTLVMYENASDFNIVNIESETPRAGPSMAVDTVEDLRRLEKLLPDVD